MTTVLPTDFRDCLRCCFRRGFHFFASERAPRLDVPRSDPAAELLEPRFYKNSDLRRRTFKMSRVVTVEATFPLLADCSCLGRESKFALEKVRLVPAKQEFE
jgi:hypothetical protein